MLHVLIVVGVVQIGEGGWLLMKSGFYPYANTEYSLCLSKFTVSASMVYFATRTPEASLHYASAVWLLQLHALKSVSLRAYLAPCRPMHHQRPAFSLPLRLACLAPAAAS